MMSKEHSGDLAIQIEALLVASAKPQSVERLAELFGAEEVERAVGSLASFWASRGMMIVVAGGYVTLSPSKEALLALAQGEKKGRRRLTDAAVQTLSFIAFNQPVTTQDIEKARGYTLSKGLMDSLLDSGLVRASLRKTNSGRAVMYITTDLFLDHYSLGSLSDLPSPEEMEELLNPPSDQTENDVPQPHDDDAFGLEIENFSSTSDTVQSI